MTMDQCCSHGHAFHLLEIGSRRRSDGAFFGLSFPWTGESPNGDCECDTNTVYCQVLLCDDRVHQPSSMLLTAALC